MRAAYPPELFRLRLKRWTFLTTFSLGNLALIFGIVGVSGDFEPWQWLGFGVYLSFLFYSVWILIQGENRVSIVPYFSKKVLGTEVIRRGEALARNCRRLDSLAVRAGVSPFSRFGFLDPPLRHKKVQWHRAGSGTKVVRALLKEVSKNSVHLDDSASVREELELLLQALSEAERQEVEFALVLWIGECCPGVFSGHHVPCVCESPG